MTCDKKPFKSFFLIFFNDMKKRQIKIDKEIYDLVRDHYLTLEHPTKEDLRVMKWISDKEWALYKHDDYLSDRARRERLDSLKIHFETKEGGDG